MLLSAEHISINFGSRQLLDDINLYLNEGDKIGIVGINGTGKSTLLRVLSGTLAPDAGTLSRNPNVQLELPAPESGDAGRCHHSGAGVSPLSGGVSGPERV